MISEGSISFIIGIIILFVFLATLPLIMAAMFLIAKYIFEPIWNFWDKVYIKILNDEE